MWGQTYFLAVLHCTYHLQWVLRRLLFFRSTWLPDRIILKGWWKVCRWGGGLPDAVSHTVPRTEVRSSATSYRARCLHPFDLWSPFGSPYEGLYSAGHQCLQYLQIKSFISKQRLSKVLFSLLRIQPVPPSIKHCLDIASLPSLVKSHALSVLLRTELTDGVPEPVVCVTVGGWELCFPCLHSRYFNHQTISPAPKFWFLKTFQTFIYYCVFVCAYARAGVGAQTLVHEWRSEDIFRNQFSHPLYRFQWLNFGHQTWCINCISVCAFLFDLSVVFIAR